MELNADVMDFVEESVPNEKMDFEEESALFVEDQCLNISELNVQFDERRSYIIVPASKLWLAIDLVARVYLSSVVKSVRNQLLPALGAFLANSFAKSLASVQKLPIPMRSRQRSKRKKSMEQAHNKVNTDEEKENTIATDNLLKKDAIDRLEEECKQLMEEEKNKKVENSPERCVDCRVLYEPEEGEIVADIVFVHGLHGGLDRTWKQGTWRQTNTFKLKNKKLIKKPSKNLNHFMCDTEQSPKRRFTKKFDSKIPSKIAKKNEENENNINIQNELKETNSDTVTDDITNKENKGDKDSDSISLDKIDFKLDSITNKPDEPTSSSRIVTNFVQIYKETISNTKHTISNTSDTNTLEYSGDINTNINSGDNVEHGSDTYSDASSNCSDSCDLDDLENYSNCWPKDWLPVDCPQCRIVTINYTTDVLWCPVWQRKRNRTNLVERSHEMTEELLGLGIGKRPIIWVGHSKGGLFIKQIILNGFESQNQRHEYYNLYENSRAIMFYSVPHKGSSLADVTFPFFRRSIELLEIKRNCEFVLNLHQRFLDIFSEESITKPEIFSFIDTVATKMGIMNIEMIAYESADPDIGTKCDVPLNHREICKPSGRDCLLYQELVDLIKRCLNLT